MSFVRDRALSNPLEQEKGVLLERRLHSLETKFIQRVVDGMPFPPPPRGAHEAEKVAIDMVADAFKRWFGPERRLFLDMWVQESEHLSPSLEQAYQFFLESVALRRGKKVFEFEEEDRWESSKEQSIDQVLEESADAFCSVVQQREDWVKNYEVLSSPERRLAYLRLANLARGFLRKNQPTLQERSGLDHAKLASQRGVVFPRVLMDARFIDATVLNEFITSFEVGKACRADFEERLAEYQARTHERKTFAEVVRNAIGAFGGSTLTGPQMAGAVSRHASFVLRLENRYRETLVAYERARSEEEKAQAQKSVELLYRQRESAREALNKARALLGIYRTAQELGVLLSAEDEHPVRLTDIQDRLAS